MFKTMPRLSVQMKISKLEALSLPNSGATAGERKAASLAIKRLSQAQGPQVTESTQKNRSFYMFSPKAIKRLIACSALGSYTYLQDPHLPFKERATNLSFTAGKCAVVASFAYAMRLSVLLAPLSQKGIPIIISGYLLPRVVHEAYTVELDDFYSK